MYLTLVNVSERDLQGRESILPIELSSYVFHGQWGIGRYVMRKLREEGFYPVMQDSEIRPFFRRGARYRNVYAPGAEYRVRFQLVNFIDDEDAPTDGYPDDVYVIVERLV